MNFAKFYCSTSALSQQSWWVTGFADAEGMFVITITKTKTRGNKSGWTVRPSFSIGLHVRDRALLDSIQAFFGVGNIRSNKATNSFMYSVYSIKELEVIINHFDKYPLITQKWADYQLFKQVVLLMKNKEHLTTEGISRIICIRASMNKGLSDGLKAALPGSIQVRRPNVEDPVIKDPNWVAGFARVSRVSSLVLPNLNESL